MAAGQEEPIDTKNAFEISSYQEVYGDSFSPIPFNPNTGSTMLPGNGIILVLVIGAIILFLIFRKK